MESLISPIHQEKISFDGCAFDGCVLIKQLMLELRTKDQIDTVPQILLELNSCLNQNIFLTVYFNDFDLFQYPLQNTEQKHRETKSDGGIESTKQPIK